jgi:signal transduction histidine kinase
MLREPEEKFSKSCYAAPISMAISTIKEGKLKEANKALELKLTEREAAILRLSRLYAVLSVTNHTIVRANDRDTLFSNICRGAVEQGGFILVWTGLIDEESGMVKPVAWHGANDGFLDNIRISVREEPEGLGPTGSAIRDGSYHICNDFNNDPRTQLWHEKAREQGINSSASIALTLNKKVIGALTIYSDEPNYFCAQMIDLLKQMAMDISFALDNLDHAARRLDAERALHAETMERLRAVEALREKEQQFIQQSRHAAMGEMIGNIAHQWRQPLNSLGLIIQQLQVCYKEGGFFKEHLDNSAGMTMDIIQHMSRTIGDFIDFFRPDKEQVTFNVTKEISKTLSLIEAVFNDQRISIEVNPSGDPVIYGHPNEFSQVLLNIMINAKDAFANRKTDSPKVTISLFTEDGKSIVSITDNAGGIPEDIMDNIFDPYFTTKGPDKGTGVGLFMSRIIIEKNMAGTLTARNTGNGAEFRIEV